MSDDNSYGNKSAATFQLGISAPSGAELVSATASEEFRALLGATQGWRNCKPVMNDATVAFIAHIDGLLAQQREAGRRETNLHQAKVFDAIRQRKNARIAELEAALATRHPVAPELSDEQRTSVNLAAAMFESFGMAGAENLRALLASIPSKVSPVEPVSEAKPVSGQLLSQQFYDDAIKEAHANWPAGLKDTPYKALKNLIWKTERACMDAILAQQAKPTGEQQ